MPVSSRRGESAALCRGVGGGSGEDTRAMGGSVGGKEDRPEGGACPSPGGGGELVGGAVVPAVGSQDEGQGG